MKKNKNKKFNIFKLLPLFLGLLIGFILGFIGDLLNLDLGIDSGNFLKGIVVYFIIPYMLGSYIQILIHEFGHFIFGRLTGYRFSSFRIGSLLITQDKDNKIRLKKFKIPGTAGQCLMIPPKTSSSYDYPYILYNLGGFINNILFSFCLLALYYFGDIRNNWVNYYLIFVSILGILMALVNIIPMKMGGISNDGYNILILSKNEESRKVFWLSLYINDLIMSGQRLKDLDDRILEEIKSIKGRNHLSYAIRILEAEYYIDKKEYTKGIEIYNNILLEAESEKSDLLDIHKNEIILELIFFEMIDNMDMEKIEKLYTKDVKTYAQKSKLGVSRLRQTYAFELLILKDDLKAKKTYEKFKKELSRFPYKGERCKEKELISLVGEKKSILDLNGTI